MIRGRGNRRKDAAPSEKKKTKKIADRLFAFRLKPEEVFLERPKKTEVGETNQKIRNVSPRKCKNVQRGIEILEEGETIIIRLEVMRERRQRVSLPHFSIICFFQ